MLFYLTWGRQFGGMQCFNSYYCSTAFADFDQMQDSMTVAYKGIADSLESPDAGRWGLTLQNYEPSHLDFAFQLNFQQIDSCIKINWEPH